LKPLPSSLTCRRKARTRTPCATTGQYVLWQTAINPVVALELLAAGTWSGAGVLGPEVFDAVPFWICLREITPRLGNDRVVSVSESYSRLRR
jgi:hypothetical protein